MATAVQPPPIVRATRSSPYTSDPEEIAEVVRLLLLGYHGDPDHKWITPDLPPGKPLDTETKCHTAAARWKLAILANTPGIYDHPKAIACRFWTEGPLHTFALCIKPGAITEQEDS